MNIHLPLLHLEVSSIYFHIFTILTAFILTYIRILGKSYYWIIDDLEGIARFSEQWQSEEVKDGKVTREEKKIDSYEIELDKKDDKGNPIKKTVKFLSFIPELGFPGNVLRFLRLHIGKRFCELGKNKKGHPVYGYRQSPIRHHILSLTIQIANLILGYFFLKRQFGQDLAFSSILLYSVYPLTTQMVAWISGINYSLCLMFTLIALNITASSLLISIPLIMMLAFLSSICLYVGAFTWAIFLFIGLPWHALAYFLVGMSVVIWKGTETKNYRVKNFKEQNMEVTTKLNWRKPIVMFKTFWYYITMVFLPIKMGLYHVWGYFYDEKIEKFDYMFWLGLIFSGLSLYGFLYCDNVIRFSILWFISYWVIFSNVITAQQFVADRYAVIPAFGVCLFLAHILNGTPFLYILFGLYAMRTYLHLPTFKNEIDFYQSNFENFRKSEVSLGNLGVAYINQGMPGAAVDMWTLSTKLNPLYDVPWYNLYSVFRGNGRFQEAFQFINNCLNSKVVHFQERWLKEREELKQILEGKNITPKVSNSSQQILIDSACQAFNLKNPIVELQCLKQFISQGTDGIAQDMLNQITKRITDLEASQCASVALSQPGIEKTQS